MIDHIYNEDCLTGMQRIPPRTVDANSGGVIGPRLPSASTPTVTPMLNP